MKKLIALFAVIIASVAANAAATSWKFTAGNMYAANGTDKYTGAFVLYATGGDLAEPTVVFESPTTVNGTYSNKAFETELLTAGNSYDFYYVLTDGNSTLTSTVLANKSALETGSTAISWGNQQTYTQSSSNWQGGSVPEPTSGLLILLGVAGLALKRKIA